MEMVQHQGEKHKSGLIGHLLGNATSTTNAHTQSQLTNLAQICSNCKTSYINQLVVQYLLQKENV